MNKLFSFRDITFVIILSIFFSGWIAVENFYKKKSSDLCIVEVNGSVYKTLALDKNCIFKVKGHLGITEIEILEKNVHIIKSVCLNHVCIKTGWISKAGEALICLPNKVIVKIPVSESDDKIDVKSF